MFSLLLSLSLSVPSILIYVGVGLKWWLLVTVRRGLVWNFRTEVPTWLFSMNSAMPARWIWLKAGSFDRSSLKSEARRSYIQFLAPIDCSKIIARSRGDGAESHRMAEGRIFLKISATLFVINAYQMNLISAGSISLDIFMLYIKLHLVQLS